jgi:hypothetical protein
MIIDGIENSGLYLNLGKRVTRALIYKFNEFFRD